MLRVRLWHLSAVLASVVASASLRAQTAPALPPLNFSGVLFGSYNFQESTTPSPLTRQIDNSFIIDRAYLNFRIAAGDHGSIRITTDLYQSAETTPNAYTIRAKYAYFQYEGDKSGSGAQLLGRIGILHNVVIDHFETFWPRYLSTTPVERQGYFSSADAGVAGLYTLPDKMGEVYATITNGPGYASRETDRFKDYAIRLSLTPLANNKDMPLLNTFTITAWGYKGATASACVVAGCSAGLVGTALDRSRAGLFVGLKDPRLVLAAEYDQRHEDGELTPTTNLVKTGTTGSLMAAYTVFRPLAFANASGKSPFGIVARYDYVKPTTSTTGFTTVPSTDNAYHTVIGGLLYDLNSKAQFTLDYQETLASANGVSATPPGPVKGYYAHFMINF